MSIVKTLEAIGNSYGVIIDKAHPGDPHITPEPPLEITTDGRSFGNSSRPPAQEANPE